MNGKQFTSRDLDLSVAVDLLENLVNSINGDPEMHLYDQDQAHAFLEVYYAWRAENE
jgi:hypothetical protein